MEREELSKEEKMKKRKKEKKEKEQKGMFLYGIKCILMSRVIGMEISSSLF